MLPIHVALVSEESNITMEELSEVAAALQKQVTRDFRPIWDIDADVSAFASLDALPLDYWPVVVMDDIGDPNAAGYHQDQHGQPYSLVQYGDDWTLTASHETLEMLGDPFGRRMVAGDSPVDGQGRVKFLVEVCDPCEADQFAYAINGVTVSDFYTPHYFDPVEAGGVRYSFNNSLTGPRQVAQGGYLSWYDPGDGQWWQTTWFSGAAPASGPIQGMQIRGGNVREAIDRVTAPGRKKVLAEARPLAAAREEGRAGGLARSYRNRAEHLRAEIKAASSGRG